MKTPDLHGPPLPLARRSREAWIRALQATSTISANPSRLLADHLGERTITCGGAAAILTPTQSLTYFELAALANRSSRWTLGRLAKGDLLMPNRPEYVAIWLGITRVGAVVALVNTNLAGAALAQAITSASPRCVIVAVGLDKALGEAFPGPAPFQTWVHEQPTNELEQYSGDPLAPSERRGVTIKDTALLIYTSGTTGLPKAAKVTHHRILQWSLWFAGLGDFKANDRMYNCLPLYHSVGGIVAVCSVLVAGGSVVIAEKFSAAGSGPISSITIARFSNISANSVGISLTPPHLPRNGSTVAARLRQRPTRRHLDGVQRAFRHSRYNRVLRGERRDILAV